MKKKLHTVATRRPLAFNGWNEEFKHNLEITVRTEFSNLLCPSAGKESLLFLIPLHRWKSSFLNKGGRGNHVAHGIMR
jgi:hypothetical protein